MLDLLVVMAGVGAGFVVTLWAGFALHHDPMPPVIDRYHLPAIVLLGAALGFLLYRLVAGGLFRRRPRRESRRVSRRKLAEWHEAERARVAALRNDPVGHVYAERIDRGEQWSDAQIAYDLEPNAIATCAHLAPIERALRAAGLVKLVQGHYLQASCVIDDAKLRAAFTVEEPAWYGLLPDYGRSYEDPPSAAIVCHEHGATIWVLEEGQAKRETPRFPA